MKTEWGHLPNAKYIDMILSNVKENTKKWDDTRIAVRSAVWRAALNITWDAARGAEWHGARSAISNVIGVNSGAVAARGAVLALVAFDDCGYLLDEKPEHVLFLSSLGGNPAAALIYPACMALHGEMA